MILRVLYIYNDLISIAGRTREVGSSLFPLDGRAFDIGFLAGDKATSHSGPMVGYILSAHVRNFLLPHPSRLFQPVALQFILPRLVVITVLGVAAEVNVQVEVWLETPSSALLQFSRLWLFSTLDFLISKQF